MEKPQKEHPDIVSQRELSSTEFRPGVAKAMSYVFVAIVFCIPLTQAIRDVCSRRTPQALDIFTPITRGVSTLVREGPARAWESFNPLFTVSFLREYEDGTADTSMLKRFFQSRLQNVLSGPLGFGNDKGVIGIDGWLYYQPGIDFLTGPGILDQKHLRLRAKRMIDRKGVRDPQLDPRPAILRFNEDCRKAGVHLVVVPIPDKAMMQPAQLTHRLRFDKPIPVPTNRDFPRFIAELRAQGVDVFDPTPSELRPGEVRYLMQDTHWTPEFMESVARDLADHIRKQVRLPEPAKPLATDLREMPVSRVGDIVDMLKLPPWQTTFLPRTVTIRQVRDAATGKPWRPTEDADVLLLGDSFSNVFSDDNTELGKVGLGWGESAGFPPHLSRFLGRPVDVIARNGSGATVTRVELARRPDPMGGKKVIVWEFAVRDLACENWRIVPVEAKKTGVAVSPAGKGEFTVVAELLTPVPAEARKVEVYANALVALKFRVVKVESGKYEQRELLVKLPSILGRKTQPAVGYQTGRAYRLRISPTVPPQYSESWTLIDQTLEFELPALWVADSQEVR